jgi:acetyl/propionyl-CoA carboxylase alpha subunit
VTTNRALLASVLADAEFRRGAVATDFLSLRRAHLQFGDAAETATDVALAALWLATRRSDRNALWEDTRGWRAAAPSSTTWRFGQLEAVLNAQDGDRYLASVEGKSLTLRVLARDEATLRAECDGQVLDVRVLEIGAALHVFRSGGQLQLTAVRTDDALQVEGGTEQGSLLTPLPGTIVAVHVENGQKVSRGSALITVEAMKMEHTLTAPYDGVVSKVAFALGDRVQAGAILVELAAL